MNELKEIKVELVNQLKGIAGAAASRIPQPVRMYARKFARPAILALAAAVVVAAVGIYGLGWQNTFTSAVSRVIPFPAGWAGGQTVSYHDYVQRARAGHTPGKLNNQQAFGELVNIIALRKLAHEANVSVTDAEIDKELELDMNARGGRQAALKEVRQLYGVNESGYRRRVETDLLRLRLEGWLAQSSEMLNQAHDTANALLAKAKQGDDFDLLVRQHSHDSSAQIEKPGLTAIAVLPQAVQTAVGDVKPGELADRAILTSNSYYLIKNVSNITQGHIQVLVVRPKNVAQWLADEVGKMKSVKLIPQVR